MEKENVFIRIWKSKEIQHKILFSLLILIIFRVLAAVPVVGIESDALQELYEGSNIAEMSAMQASGIIKQASVISIGLGPYIQASVMLQLLSTVIPKLAEIRKEGAEGQRKINMYSRFLTIPIAILQAFAIYSALRAIGGGSGQALVGDLSTLQLVTMISSLTAGATLMMWFGELVTESGLGGGSTLLIFYGIISNVPYLFDQNIKYSDALEIGIVATVYVFLIGLVVFISEAEQRIKILYSRRVKSSSKYESYIPLKLTQSGVMPVIFATSIFYFPQLLIKFLSGRNLSGEVVEFMQIASKFLANPYVKNIGLVLMIVLFSFFYVTIVFNTDELAENLQKQGAFLKGIRPGKITAKFLRRESFKLTAVGSVFLALLAILPGILKSGNLITITIVSGTGLLIAVGTVLDIKRSVESMIVVRSYDKYL